jgi:hypothetical protein
MDQLADEAAVAHDVELEPERFDCRRHVLDRLIDMVDSVYGMPPAPRQAMISPSPCIMPPGRSAR